MNNLLRYLTIYLSLFAPNRTFSQELSAVPSNKNGITNKDPSKDLRPAYNQDFTYTSVTDQLHENNWHHTSVFPEPNQFSTNVKEAIDELIQYEVKNNIKYITDFVKKKLEYETPEQIEKNYNIELKNLSTWKMKNDKFTSQNFPGMILNSNQSAAEILKNIYLHVKFLECHSAATLFQYKLILNTLQDYFGTPEGNKIFDNFFGSTIEKTPDNQRIVLSSNGPMAGTHLFYRNEFLPYPSPNPISYFLKMSPIVFDYNNGYKDVIGTEGDRGLKVGSLVYFKNHKQYHQIHPGGDGQGWNVIYAGKNEANEDLFWGFQFKGYKTEKQIKTLLADDFNRPIDNLDQYYFKQASTQHNVTFKISANDVTYEPQSIVEFDKNKINSLLENPKKTLADYRQYLEAQAREIQRLRESEALEVRRLNDIAFKNGSLPRPPYKSGPLDMTVHPLQVTQNELQQVANELGLRYLGPTSDNHACDIIDDNYKIFMRLTNHKGNAFLHLTTEYNPKKIADKLMQLNSPELRNKFYHIINAPMPTSNQKKAATNNPKTTHENPRPR